MKNLSYSLNKERNGTIVNIMKLNVLIIAVIMPEVQFSVLSYLLVRDLFPPKYSFTTLHCLYIHVNRKNGILRFILCILGGIHESWIACDDGWYERIVSFLMWWVFMHIALKGCRPPHTNEPLQFWIGFGLVLIGGSGLDPLGLLTLIG